MAKRGKSEVVASRPDADGQAADEQALAAQFEPLDERDAPEATPAVDEPDARPEISGPGARTRVTVRYVGTAGAVLGEELILPGETRTQVTRAVLERAERAHPGEFEIVED